jgi:hypothetical protein
MKKSLRILLIIGIVGVITGGFIAYRIFTKPHRDVTKEQGVSVSAQALYDAFHTNEAAANAKYLDKAIQIQGEVANVSTNQDGKTVIDFKTNDPFVVINCTFKQSPGALHPGETVTFKGICTGYIPDANVVINDGVLVP